MPQTLSVTELIDLYRGFYRAPRSTAEVLELVGLGDKAGARVRTLSGGQQRRLDVGLGLVGDPELIFLDEPTTGFDPSARRNAWDLVRRMRDLGKTVLLTTHYMDEAQNLADRICVIAAGQVVAAGPPATLRAAGRQRAVIRFEVPAGVPIDALPLRPSVVEGLATVETDTPTRAMQELTSWAVARDLELGGLELSRPSLEDVYLELTGGE